MIKEAKVEDLIPDDKNFNAGNEYGESLIEKSFEKFGAGRSILIDKNNHIIAGNKSHQKFTEKGGEKVIIVETDGNTLVAVKRTDIDLNTKQGRELALADNASAKANIEWDTPILFEAAAEFDIIPMDWGIHNFQTSPDVDYSLLDEDLNSQLQDMANGVKKAIQIEFEPDHYEEAYALVSFWRKQGSYVGKMILDFLKAEKNKL